MIVEGVLGTYRAVGDSKECEEHVVVSAGHELAYHCLGVLCTRLVAIAKAHEMRMSYRVVGSLEESENHIVEIKFPLEPISL